MADEIPSIPPIPPALRDAAQRGTLIPFIGAGASILGGCPDWQQLAEAALSACIQAEKFNHGQKDQIGHLAPRMKISIARAIEAEHGLNIDYAKMIHPKDYADADGQRVYRSLGKLAKTFVTTNYDAWLDTEIPEPQLSVASVTAAQDTTATAPRTRRRIIDVNEFTPANLNQENCVFHLHGSVVDPAGMVMTTRDYIRRYANDRRSDDPALENRTLTFLEFLFERKTVLFIGYGLEDLEILEYVVQKARQQSSGRPQARHFMLQGYFAHEYELMRSLRRYYAQCDIELLPFRRDQRNWKQLIEVLEAFAAAMPAQIPLGLQKQMEMESLLDE